MAVIVGTSGWQYDSWKELFYPAGLPKKQWLPYFSARFPTVEVNNTFYNMPAEETFDSWREASAEGFIIGIKASRYITHIRRLTDPADPVKLLWERCLRLRHKLGPVLYQLPPNFKLDMQRLEGLLAVLPSEIQAAVEFRHPSWERQDVYDLLDGAGCALVLPDRPGARPPDVVTGGWSYVRFHQGTAIGPHYRRSKLRRWAARIANMDARDVFVYFNNDPQGAAIRDAHILVDLLAEEGADVVPLPSRRPSQAEEREDQSASSRRRR